MPEKKWLCDERTGCVAVYWAENYQNCLDGVQYQENCAFFETGHTVQGNYGLEWRMNRGQINKARMITRDLNDYGYEPEITEEDCLDTLGYEDEE
jgi:hypothetical protein